MAKALSESIDPLLEAKFAADGNVNDPHRWLRDAFVLYADFGRPILLQEIAAFINHATVEEVSDLRRRLKVRKAMLAATMAHRGRPRANTDLDKQTRALRIFWWRTVEDLTWPQVLGRLDMANTKPNVTTATRWYVTFTEKLNSALSQFGLADADESCLRHQLDGNRLQTWLQIQTGLPFRKSPEKAKRAVLVAKYPRAK